MALSNEEKLKSDDEYNGLLKFSDWDPIHDVVRDKVNTAVDSIAIDRELELETEESLIQKKKEELKKWFSNNYSHELNQRGANGMTQGGQQAMIGGKNIAFTNLINMASQFDNHNTEWICLS